MKKVQPFATVIAASVLLVSGVYAGGHDHGGRYESARHMKMSNHHNSDWVVPLMIGGVLGYVLAEPRHESVTYVQNTPTPIVFAPQPMYQEQWVYFSDCDCQRKVLVRVR